jgi:mRNA interferase MazF
VENYDHTPPRRGQLSLAKAPRPRELYWARFPEDAELPEFWKERPVVVLSSKASLSSTVFVVPCTSVQQGDNAWSVRLDSSIDGRESWAICDKPTSLAVTRLRPQKGGPRVSEQDFARIISHISSIFPQAVLGEARKREILRLLVKRHPDLFETDETATQILDSVLGLLRTVKG